MKFYSEVLNKIFDTSKELKEAEQAHASKHNTVNELKDVANQHIDNIVKEMEEFSRVIVQLNEVIDDEDEAADMAIELITKIMAAVSRL